MTAQLSARAAPSPNPPSAPSTAPSVVAVAPARAAATAAAAEPGQDVTARPSVILAASDGSQTADSEGDDDSSDEDGVIADDPDAPVLQAFSPFAFTPAVSPEAAAAATPASASAADLAAQMAAKVTGGASQFRLQLNPLGLGRVDVTVSIGADRRLTAALAFSDPQSASALSAHAGELKSALEQAGFSVPANGFAFSSSPTATRLQAGMPAGGFDLGAGASGFGGSSAQQGGGRSANAAFSAGEALAGGGEASGWAAKAWSSAADSRLDIRI